MIENVIKRDGTLEKYNFEKIVNAVALAFNSCKKELTPDIVVELKAFVENGLNDIEEVDIELIQDIVITFLNTNYEDIGKHYKKVRDSRERARNRRNKVLRGMREKLDAKNIENQNANVDEMSFGGRKGEAMEVATKAIALEEYISDMARKNHLENRDYIHDLGSYADGEHNCLSIPFDKLLANGFKVKQTDVRPAGSIGTAAQLIAVIFQLQSLQQFGGVSATHLDWTLAPYVKKSFMKHYILAYLKTTEAFIKLDLMRMIFEEDNEKIYDGGNVYEIHRSKFDIWIKDNKEKCIKELGLNESDFYIGNTNLNPGLYQSALLDTINETKQSIEGMYHNLNTLQSRSGNQLPFTSINYGTCTSPEGRLVIEALLEISINGLGSKHKTSIFPCGIWQYMKGVNDKPGTPNYDLKRKAIYSTATRFYPNYANVDWSGNAGYDRNDPRTYFSTMGCRTANGWDINGFGQLKDGRGNICPCTIILPTLAMESLEISDKKIAKMNYASPEFIDNCRIDTFLSVLEKNIGEVKDMLLERFEWICSQSYESARFMYENGTMEGYIPEEGIRSALKHGTLAIGQLGLAECLQILIKCDHTCDKGMEAAKCIEELFKKKAAEYKEKYKLNFGVYYTPAENLCHTALKKFRAKYGVIPNVSDREYFTNSMHVPVWHEMDPFQKIDIESQLTGYSSAGCITYVELPASAKHNVDAVEKIVDYMMEKDIPYGAINTTVDQCLDCGYTDEIAVECPICHGTHIFRPRRVTGYLSDDYLNFNHGKVCETDDRVKHVKN